MLVSISQFVAAQSKDDLSRMLKHSNDVSGKEADWHHIADYESHKKAPLARKLLNAYQEHITYHLYSNCIYSQSCSQFARHAIERGGIVSGILLGIDRLGRCNQLEFIRLARKFDQDGEFSDPAREYYFK